MPKPRDRRNLLLRLSAMEKPPRSQNSPSVLSPLLPTTETFTGPSQISPLPTNSLFITGPTTPTTSLVQKFRFLPNQSAVPIPPRSHSLQPRHHHNFLPGKFLPDPTIPPNPRVKHQHPLLLTGESNYHPETPTIRLRQKHTDPRHIPNNSGSAFLDRLMKAKHEEKVTAKPDLLLPVQVKRRHLMA
ncbi:hypothetical protein HK098_005528 [Nowakowskiella sp. JEL0407]|nr:hypothetical protein HK098_005528 [Nowakowskiella sp. JEL0407]